MLADMTMQIEAARSLVYDCAGIADAGFESDAAFRAFSGLDGKMLCE
jgi:alkylation response protein AidB-like acyl-CoA dehydrogenase